MAIEEEGDENEKLGDHVKKAAVELKYTASSRAALSSDKEYVSRAGAKSFSFLRSRPLEGIIQYL
jgi:hypothetical protein